MIMSIHDLTPAVRYLVQEATYADLRDELAFYNNASEKAILERVLEFLETDQPVEPPMSMLWRLRRIRLLRNRIRAIEREQSAPKVKVML